jgi:putative FmdB family regulatory protein
MPIYAYRCAHCGHEKDVLRKLSDAPLTQCPACGKDTFSKQVTAAGFQLKGSGWYVTDFRGGNGAPKAPAAKSDDASSSSVNADNPAGPASSNASDSATPASTSSPDAAKPAAGASASSGAA